MCHCSPDGFREMVLDAVYRADPSDEKTWIEWKSSLDLRSKEAMAKTVAKAIIAFANRDPDRSAETVGGIGILVIGLEPGAVHGVDRVDNADLDKLITPYVGAQGPIWEPHWTQYDGKQILIIEVAAPRWGDRIHCFRKAFLPIASGAVYVRKLAQSVPATPEDLDRLADRYAAKTVEGLEVAVSARYPRALSRYVWPTYALQNLLDNERDELLGPMRDAQAAAQLPKSDVASVDALVQAVVAANWRGSVFPLSSPERRTPQEFEQEVEDYLNTITRSWPTLMRKVAAHFAQAPHFMLTNRAARNLRQVQVKIAIAGEVDIVKYRPDASPPDFWNLLPEKPRPWGPQTLEYPFGLQTPVVGLAPIGLASLHTIASVIDVEVDHDSAGVTMTFPPIDLRPHDEVVLSDAWSVLAPATRTDAVTATWSATATNLDGPAATGRFTIDFTGPDIDILEGLAQAHATK
jgi:hypothetical protein